MKQFKAISPSVASLCKNCGNEFPYIKRNHYRVFCSRLCQASYIKEYKICENPNCRISFPVTNRSAQNGIRKFCSISCSAVVRNGNVIRRKIPNCLHCQKSMVNKSGKKFCSPTCSAQYRITSALEDWIGGKVSASDGDGGLGSSARNYLLKQANYTCQCGWNTPNPILGYPILTIDHIDGNWQNNYISNLVVLCYNCHTLTPTFGTLNIGNPNRSQNRVVNPNRVATRSAKIY